MVEVIFKFDELYDHSRAAPSYAHRVYLPLSFSLDTCTIYVIHTSVDLTELIIALIIYLTIILLTICLLSMNAAIRWYFTSEAVDVILVFTLCTESEINSLCVCFTIKHNVMKQK